MDEKASAPLNKEATDDFDELADLLGSPESELERNEKVILTQNLEGFANCFPDWDLHPPVRK